MQSKFDYIKQVFHKFRLILVVISLVIPLFVGYYAGKTLSAKNFGRYLYVNLMAKKAIISDNQGYFQEIPYNKHIGTQDMTMIPNPGSGAKIEKPKDLAMAKGNDKTKTKQKMQDGSMGGRKEQNTPEYNLRNDLKHPRRPKKPIISIIIQNFGANKMVDKFIMQNMPKLTSVTISPYREDHAELTAKAFKAKFAPIIKVSMEPNDYPASDPGFNTLLSGLSKKMLRERIKWYLKTESDTFINFMGSKFLRDKKGMAMFCYHLSQNDKVFIDDRTTPSSVSAKMGRAKKAKVIGVDINLSTSWLNGTTMMELKNARKIAIKSGYCIILCDNNLKLLQIVAIWARKQRKHFEFRSAQEIAYLKARGVI